MDEFLKKLKMSDEAINLYKRSLGKWMLTYNELHSLTPSLSLEDFEKILNELKSSKLVLEIKAQKPEILVHYFSIPPYSPILIYFQNIKMNLSNIQDAVQGLMINTLNDIFQDKKKNKIELNTLLSQFQEIKKDIDENVLIQKQDVEEIVIDFENLKEIKTVLSSLKELENDFYVKIIDLIQREFTNFINLLMPIKTEIKNRIKLLELKKREPPVIEIVEDVFKKQLNKIIQDFSLNLRKLIESEFKRFQEPLNEKIVDRIHSITNDIFQYQNDFKLLYLNVINDFEIKMNKIQNVITDNKIDLEKKTQILNKVIVENLGEIIEDAIEQFSSFNDPVVNLMQQFLTMAMSSNRMTIDDVRILKSKILIDEEIAKLLTNSKDEIMIIIPKIEYYLSTDQFQNLPPGLKIKIVSSDPHTNSLVKKFKEIPNLEFRTIKNEFFVAIKGDDNYLIINTLQLDSDDPLNNNLGIIINYKPLINILNPIINTTWNNATPDFDMQYIRKTPVSKVRAPAPIKSTLTPKTKAPTPPKTIPIPVSKVKLQPKPKIKKFTRDEVIKTTPPIEVAQVASEGSSAAGISGEAQVIGDYTSRFHPKAGDQVAMKINSAFNELIQSFSNLTGEEFSKELQDVADLILEIKGFSVTLHSVRNVINKYKELDSLLNKKEKMEIFDAIEDWKQRLF